MAAEKEPQKLQEKGGNIQIILPNGYIVSMKEGKNSRNLNILNEALNKRRSCVSSDELIAPDLSSGMSEEESRQSLHNSFRTLRTRHLVGSGYTIKIFRDKKGHRTASANFSLAETSSETKLYPITETVILDEKTTITLPQRSAAMFRKIKGSGEDGLTSEQLQQPHIDAGKSPKRAKSLVRDDFGPIWIALKNLPFKVVNRTTKEDYLRGEKARYVFIEEASNARSRKRRKSTPDQHSPADSSAIHVDSPTAQSQMEIGQRPQTIFIAGDSVVLEKSNPPPENLTQPVAEVLPKDKMEIAKRRREFLEKITLHVASKTVQGTFHRETFGINLSDQLKINLINGVSEVLDKYWNEDPNSSKEDITEVGRQIIPMFAILKRRDYIKRDILNSLYANLRIPLQ